MQNAVLTMTSPKLLSTHTKIIIIQSLKASFLF